VTSTARKMPNDVPGKVFKVVLLICQVPLDRRCSCKTQLDGSFRIGNFAECCEDRGSALQLAGASGRANDDDSPSKINVS
jgi:hypothetical protein